MTALRDRWLAVMAILTGIAVMAYGVLLPLQWQPTASGVDWIHVAKATPQAWRPDRAVDGEESVAVSLPDPWRLSGRTDVWTYHMALPDEARGESGSTALRDITYGLWIPRACTVLAVWLDKQLIAGLEDSNSRLNCNKPWLVSIPHTIGTSHQRHIHIVVKGRADRGDGLSSIAYGPLSLLGSLNDAAEAVLIGGGLAVLATTLLLSIGGGWVAFRQRSSTAAMFMTVSLSMGVREAIFLGGSWLTDAKVNEALTYATSGVAIVISGFLLLRYVEHRSPLWEKAAKILLLLFLPTLGVTLFDIVSVRDAMLPWYYLSHLAGLWITIVVAKEAVIRPSTTRTLILLSVEGLMVLTILDDWHAFISAAPSSYEFIRLAPFASISALFAAVVSTYIRIAVALKIERRFKLELLKEVELQRAELERLHAIMQEKAKAEVAFKERARIARDLHDGLGTQLVHMLSNMETGQVTINHLRHELNDLLDQLRLTMDAVDPVAKDIIDLLAQIRYRLSDRWRQAGIASTWSVEPLTSEKHFTAEELTSFQRLLYEVFANIVKHAKASHVSISTFSHPQQNVCGIVIRDNGIGFVSAPDSIGRGILNMTSRADEMGIAFKCDSELGKGTQITLGWAILNP